MEDREKIVELKKSLGLKNKDIANLVKVSTSFVSYVLQGKRKITSVFVKLFLLWEYFQVVKNAIKGLQYIESVFPGQIGIKADNIYMSVVDYIEFLKQESEQMRKKIKLRKEMPHTQKILNEIRFLKNFSLYSDIGRQKDWKYHEIKEDGLFCVCGKLEVVRDSFVLEYLSETVCFRIKGEVRDLLCIWLAYFLNLKTNTFALNKDYISCRSTQIFWEKEDFEFVKVLIEDFIKKNKIDFSHFINFSVMLM